MILRCGPDDREARRGEEVLRVGLGRERMVLGRFQSRIGMRDSSASRLASLSKLDSARASRSSTNTQRSGGTPPSSASVSSKIAGINTNITNLEAKGADEDHRARIDVTIEISDLKHLEKVMKSLRSKISSIVTSFTPNRSAASGERTGSNPIIVIPKPAYGLGPDGRILFRRAIAYFKTS
mgnify:CR=1 FL=1